MFVVKKYHIKAQEITKLCFDLKHNLVCPNPRKNLLQRGPAGGYLSLSWYHEGADGDDSLKMKEA